MGFALVAALTVFPVGLGEASDRDVAGAPAVAAPGLTDARAVLGEGARLRASGLYAVKVQEGRTLLTHGPDPAPALGPRASGAAKGPRRPPVCASETYTHFVLALPRGREVRARRAHRRAKVAVARANGLLNASSRVAGGPSADLEVRCNRRGHLSMARLRYRGRSFAALVRTAQRRGFDDAATDYAIIVRARHSRSCGAASFEGDERLSSINVNNVRGGYAVVYRPCWTGEDVLHEVGHLQGAVQYRAPYSTGSGRHCWDERDVMCYAPDGGDLHQAGTIPRCSAVSFDCGNDTYFDPTPEAGEWLSEHWNLGSPLNHYIRFGLG